MIFKNDHWPELPEHEYPRHEYPRPQFSREDWISLNGEWDCETDRAVSGIERRLYEKETLPEKIIVPFCRESELSGIGDRDFCACVWYCRKITLPYTWLKGSVILNIGACDYITDVWVNGVHAGHHVGGYVSFSFDITKYVKEKDVIITIRAYDDTRSGLQAGGKQSQRFESHGCSYTRTTGIWQSVWLEHAPKAYIKSAKYYTDILESKLTIEAECVAADGLALRAEAFWDHIRAVGCACGSVSGNVCHIEMKLDELHLWKPGKGGLYDLRLTLDGDDVIDSYFGMRSVKVEDGRLFINGEYFYQRLVLDQGFYPDGIYTAPTEKELFADIRRSMDMGFNGARLHQKIFEPQFLSECDKRGYVVWGEHGNWGMDISRPESALGFLPEWCEAVERDFNHPAIIGWCPLNETQGNQKPDFVRAVALLTRTLDPTRAFIDASGWTHVEDVSDILDMHCYEQDPAKFAEKMAPAEKGEALDLRNGYHGVPHFMSEYGGVRWTDDASGWGYGNAPSSPEEFVERLRGLTKAICDNSAFYGFCYTQLTDVEQEQNGLYTYQRVPKFPPEVMKEIFTQKSVTEE